MTERRAPTRRRLTRTNPRAAAIACALTTALVGWTACDSGIDDEKGENQDTSAEETEEVGQLEQPIEEGVVDTEFNATYPGSVVLWMNDTPSFHANRRCSGTLISPRWVITAAHCIERPLDDELLGYTAATQDWDVYVNPYGVDWPPPSGYDDLVYQNEHGPGVAQYGRRYHHSYARSGAIPYLDGPESWSVDNPAPNRDRDLDIALIKLDERVPHPVGIHARLPLTMGACADQSGFFAGQTAAARLVGFGTDGFEGEDRNGDDIACPSDAGRGRRQKAVGFINWTRKVGPDASNWIHTFTATSDPCTQMSGIGSGGDSGGSLYKYQSGYPHPLLCGVISGDGEDNQDSNGSQAWSIYHTVALDDQLILNWIALQRVLDADEQPSESYEPLGNGDDGDHDGVADLWDNCPDDPNTNQLTQNDDPDFDGVGNECETCVGSNAVGYLNNANYEIEVLTGKPQLRDWCDPMPVPTQQLRDDYGTMPAGAIPSPPALHHTELTNWIDVDIQGLPSGATATAGLRWCDCTGASGATSTPEGRAACRGKPSAPCLYNPADYGSSSVWKKIKTPRTLNPDNTENWATTDTGREWTALGATGFATSWDFRALGSAVTTTSSSQFVKGMLWATVRSVSQNIAGISAADIQERGATLGDGSAKWEHAEDEFSITYAPSNDSVYCPTCPQHALNPYFEVSNPQWRSPIEGASIPMAVPESRTAAHYSQVAAGTVLHVTASEPLAILQKTFRLGEPKARSVGVVGQSVTRILTSDRTDQLPVFTTFSALNASPSAASNRGYAFSASRQRVYAFGGVTSSGRVLLPTNEGWMLDIGSRSWRRFAFPAGEIVGAVAASTYRWQDSAVYFLDKSGTTLRLRRWKAQENPATGAIQTLATFPSSWNAFAKLDLVSTVDGGMLLVASDGTGTEKTRIAKLDVSNIRVLHLGGIWKSNTIPLLGLPAVGDTGFTMLRLPTASIIGGAPTKPYSTTVAFTSMPAGVTGDRPTFLPH